MVLDERKLIDTMTKDMNIGSYPDNYPISLRDSWLGTLYRGHVINAVKAPLMMAIILAWKLMPCKPTSRNCRRHNTHLLLEFKQFFLEHYDCDNRKDLLEAFIDIFIAEYEHDDNYPDYFDLFAEYITEKVNNGSWRKLPSGRPDPEFWKLTREENNGDT